MPQTGKIERRFVDLAAVYPNDDDSVEMSFEELRAKSRGWLDRNWNAENRPGISIEPQHVLIQQEAPLIELDEQVTDGDIRESHGQIKSQGTFIAHSENTILIDLERDEKVDRPRRMTVKEVKGETQTSMTTRPSSCHRRANLYK